MEFLRGINFWMRDARCGIQDTRCGIQDTRCRILDTGYWILGAGFDLRRYLQITECILNLVSRIILKMKDPAVNSRIFHYYNTFQDLLFRIPDIQVGTTQRIDQCLVFGSNFFRLFFIIQG